MNKTKIDWCDSTWNPVTGCLHGCEYCYARGIANRFAPYDLPHITEEGVFKHINDLESPIITNCNDGKDRICAYPYGFEPTFHRYRLDEYQKKNGRNIFVCSMADLFGEWVPDEWIEKVFESCMKAPQHNYIFLTKNVKRYCEWSVPAGCNNMWYGITVAKESDMRNFNSLPVRCKTFVSMEPLLEDLKPQKHNILFRQVNWVIIGAETGRRKDKVVPKRKWIEDIVQECQKHNVPIFMKSSLTDIWREQLIQEFPKQLIHETDN